MEKFKSFYASSEIFEPTQGCDSKNYNSFHEICHNFHFQKNYTSGLCFKNSKKPLNYFIKIPFQCPKAPPFDPPRRRKKLIKRPQPQLHNSSHKKNSSFHRKSLSLPAQNGESLDRLEVQDNFL